jgi:Glycosyl transferase 4-like domain
MLFNKAYFFFKPFLPARMRLAIRRWRARAKQYSYSDVWPIDEKAGALPPNWPGWPEGKRFAVVLTHDVETQKGLERVQQLTDLEISRGFRSSFYFVPEGDYSVSREQVSALDRAGFEVGVHGLEHDGKLFSSKSTFALKAARIREHARRWGACGFRSPLMQHRLAWLHQLGLEYDASTFDTDPFEPEPDGVGTIFPFWVPGQNGGGYVELPYTMVQDHTLFVVLRQAKIDIWKRKLDWIAARGGMALLITHPDYMYFGEGKKAWNEFPASWYEELLSYIHEKYAGAFWSATPREVARFYCGSLPVSSRSSRKKICMVTHSIYESGDRVRCYSEALAKRGDHVDVITVGNGIVRPDREEIRGVTVNRVRYLGRNGQNKWTSAWRLLSFLWTSSMLLTRRHSRVRYDLVHLHNISGSLALLAWYPKLTGARVVFDPPTPDHISSKEYVHLVDSLSTENFEGQEK